ncbi:conserved protein of unknown function [Tenacibaculum sp. 190524A02b]
MFYFTQNQTKKHMPTIETIDDVINTLKKIIDEAITNKSTTGYFAALYLKVTEKVKEGISNNFFENGERMEKLDVIFAKRYIEAYYNYQKNKPVTLSWEKAFSISDKYWPIVLQHLLIGMNAHINLDLGIAAAQVSEGKPINDLKNDFNKINTILASLVNEVENDLSKVWPFLKKILKYTHKIDNFLVNFSMELARNGAWKFATKVANTPKNEISEVINQRDIKVAKNASIIISPGLIPQILFRFIRIGEKGSVKDKIDDLMQN